MMYKAPTHLSAKAKRWWRSIAEEYLLAQWQYELLSQAAQTLDRIEELRKDIRKHGMTYHDRFGQPGLRPEMRSERDNKALFARLLRDMGLPIEEDEL